MSMIILILHDKEEEEEEEKLPGEEWMYNKEDVNSGLY